MKKAFLLILFLFLFNLTIFPKETKILAKKGKGVLLKIQGNLVLRLEGTPFEIGYQHGFLLKSHIKKMVDRILWIGNTFSRTENEVYGSTLEEAWKRTKPWIEKRYIDEMRGLSQGASIPLEKIEKANIFPELFHCSGFALWGKATKDGRLLHGRILDYITKAGIQDHAVTFVVKPKGKIPFMNIGFAGFIGSVTGMNAEGIGIGEMGGRGEGLWDGKPMALLFRKALEEAKTLKEAIQIFQRARRTCEYYYVISDSKIPRAVGLWCKPNLFFLIEPGISYPKLPYPFEDALLLSQGKRYEELVKRVKRNYGTFTPYSAVELMKRPVAMESNLQCVLFDVTNHDAYIQIAADPKTKKYQACYQPVFKLNMDEILNMKIKGKRDEIKITETHNTRDILDPFPPFENGKIPKSIIRPMFKEKDPRLKQMISFYKLPREEWTWELIERKKTREYKVYELTFPSPYKSQFPENNTVYCEYFRSYKKGKRPAAIVLHILDGRFMVARLASSFLARRGIHALLLKLPFYGRRRPKGFSERILTKNIGYLINGVKQGVMDIRRAALWLSQRKEVDPNKISIVGVSLGGFVGALTSGIDGGFYKTVIILAGGRLDKVLLGNSKEVRSIKRTILKMGIDENKLYKLVKPIDPCTFAKRIKEGSLLMINTKHDNVVPKECALSLFNAAGKNGKIIWYPGNHYSLTMYALAILNNVADYIGN